MWFLDRNRFDGEIGHMRSYRPSDRKDPYLWELPLKNKSEEDLFSLQFFLNHKCTKFEWPHPPDPVLAWWLQQYIAEYIAYKLDGIVCDSHLPENHSPDYFIKYPVVHDWIAALGNLSTSSVKDPKFTTRAFIRDLQKNVPDGLWRVVSRTNGFEKQFDITQAK